MPAVAKSRAAANEKARSKRVTALREPARVVARFDIRYRQFLDQQGKPTGDLPAFARDRDQMVKIYRCMVATRTFDARAVSLQRTGQLGTFPSSLGQEAAEVGLAAGMHDDDVLLGTYREQGAQLWRGVSLVELFRYWGGNESGTNYAVPRQDFPPSIPIATHALHAVGVATAMKLRKQKRCAVCVLGDGATSKGDFYEALNVAGVWNLPVVFVVNNNGWAISVPLGKQTACETLAQKAIAGGFEGEQVDGNDVIAVRHAVGEAVERARAGKGPSLVESLTYRLSDHTTADDATRYRRDEEVSAAWSKDPVARLRNWLGAQGWWTKEDEERLIAGVRNDIDAAKDQYLAETKEPASAMFDYLYEKLPDAIAAQHGWIEDDHHG
jgi:pyruvate dehydrogenase E1 component alpha subunit